MKINTHDVGDLVELRATFTKADGVTKVDPTKVVCTVEHPDGFTETPAVTKVETGVYKATVEVTETTVDQPKVAWRYAFDGTGTFQASSELYFLARRREIDR